jgi:hypothetical protein
VNPLTSLSARSGYLSGWQHRAGVIMLRGESSPPADLGVELHHSARSDEPNSADNAADVRQLPPDPALANITDAQIRDVNVMVDYAVRRGLEIPSDVLHDIALAKKQQLRDGEVSSELSVRFIAASTKLVRLISPATLDSIDFSSVQGLTLRHAPKKIARRYNTLGIFVFFVLLLSQIYWLVLHGTIEDIKAKTGHLKPYQTLMEIAWQEIGNNPTSDKVEMWMMSKVGDFQRRTNLYTAPNIRTASHAAKDTHNGPDNQIDFTALSIAEFLKLKNSLFTDFDVLDLLVFHLSAQSNEEIGYFESYGIAGKTLSNIVEAEYILQMMSQLVLPVVYGFMGAAVFLVRKISREYSRESLSENSTVDFRLRFFLGGVAGLAIAWFLAPSTEQLAGAASTSLRTFANLSPLVMSFVGGYAVDLMFSLIDRIVLSFTESSVKQA